MSSKHRSALLGVAAWVMGCLACSTPSAGVAPENGTDASIAPLPARLDVDGTSGQPCHHDADCVRDGGPGVNRCSSGQPTTRAGVTVQRFAIPVCVVSAGTDGHSCDPAPSGDPGGANLHFCDGPDDASAPGVCVPDSTPPRSGAGTCLPKCSFALDGSPAVGCLGSAACFPLDYLPELDLDLTLSGTGYGYCQGFCQTDGDCSALGAAYRCQTDLGECTEAPIPRTQPPGAACIAESADCLCAAGDASAGYCTSACVIGGATCPEGWLCDNGEPRVVTFTGPFPATLDLLFDGGATVPTIPISSQTTGTGGTCYAPCLLPHEGMPALSDASMTLLDIGSPGDATTEGSTTDDAGQGPDSAVAQGGDAGVQAGDAGVELATCPPNASCRSTSVAGPDCVPGP
jgi:hypothetical protein